MKILVYSETTAKNIKTRLGTSEYSYFFVLKEFLPILESLGDVHTIEHPEEEVDRIYLESQERGEHCIFLSFTPPHRTLTTLYCPTIPVFAWEFDSIPNEAWLGRAEEDWSWVIRLFGRAITHSDSTIAAIRKVVDPYYPLLNAPAPVWDAMETVRKMQANLHDTELAGQGTIFDTKNIDLARFLSADADLWHAAVHATPIPKHLEHVVASFVALEPEEPKSEAPMPTMFSSDWWKISKRYAAAWYVHALKGLPLKTPVSEPEQTTAWWTAHDIEPQLFATKSFKLRLEGVVFTSVFNPYDGRKNWQDLLSAFCSAFADNNRATLLFKLTHKACTSAIVQMLQFLARLPKFKCRVVFLHGYLEDDQYRALVHATSFIVNASYGEGQCLPLMEFLSAGKPAISPDHSGMSDYIDTNIAYVVDSWPEATNWPHDPRLAIRTCRRQINWSSLRNAFKDAFEAKNDDSGIYSRMSTSAIERMRQHCSHEAIRYKLEPFLMDAARAIETPHRHQQ